jgi:NAD(P)-dependent dehydrogenase (short-subunit alcohol dehydrogenase family)
MKLANKTALITGGGSGIGAGCAVALAREGCRVAIAGRQADKLADVARRYAGSPPLSTHPVDVADRESVTALFQWANRELGHIDILVNCAGVNTAKRSIHDLPPEEWDRLLAINATGAYNCIHEVLPQMKARRDGLIVNVNSTSGVRAGLLGGVAYNASKFAMSALGISVAQEVRDFGIRVTNIYPGEVDTPILEHRPVPVSAEHRARILQPEDVAAVLVTIASLPPRANVSEIIIKPTIQAFC